MRVDASLRLFSHLAARPESELDLPRAALLLGEPDHPGLDIAAYLDRLDELGALARARLFGAGLPRGLGDTRASASLTHRRVAQLLQLLYGELGFAGNTADFYDPRNSFLSEVLDRRTGIPISLALMLVEVATRAGLPAHGVGFPGHFLVRFPASDAEGGDEDGEPVLVDPFEGRILDAAALSTLSERHTGRPGAPDARALEPASKANTLIRMLNNLRGIYAAREEGERLRGILERLEVLAPSTELRRQIEALGGTLNPPPRSRPSPLH